MLNGAQSSPVVTIILLPPVCAQARTAEKLRIRNAEKMSQKLHGTSPFSFPCEHGVRRCRVCFPPPDKRMKNEHMWPKVEPGAQRF